MLWSLDFCSPDVMLKQTEIQRFLSHGLPESKTIVASSGGKMSAAISSHAIQADRLVTRSPVLADSIRKLFAQMQAGPGGGATGVFRTELWEL